jgi:toxin HigB-1
MPKLVYAHSYEKRAVRFLERYPELEGQYTKTLLILEKNPSHPSLRLHKLQGRMSALHSASINHSYRITIKFIIKKNEIIPIDVGKNDEVH